jgi:hypothetical protein
MASSVAVEHPNRLDRLSLARVQAEAVRFTNQPFLAPTQRMETNGEHPARHHGIYTRYSGYRCVHSVFSEVPMRQLLSLLLFLLLCLGLPFEALARSFDLYPATLTRTENTDSNVRARGYLVTIRETTDIAGLDWWVNIPTGTTCTGNVWDAVGTTVLYAGTMVSGSGVEQWVRSEIDFTLVAGSSYHVGFSCSTTTFAMDWYGDGSIGDVGPLPPYLDSRVGRYDSTSSGNLTNSTQVRTLMRVVHHLDLGPTTLTGTIVDTNVSRGFRAVVNTSTTISALEIQGMLPVGGSVAARIYDASGTLLRSGSVVPGNGVHFNYRSAFTPLTLAAGSTYYFVFYHPSSFTWDYANSGGTTPRTVGIFLSGVVSCASGSDVYPGGFCSNSFIQAAYVILQPSDGDADGVSDLGDNCPFVANTTQTNADGDVPGDACDTCTDLDGDGYGNLSYPLNTCTDDCNDTAVGTNPGATEVVGNLIDEDCSGWAACFQDSDNDTYGSTTVVANGKAATGGVSSISCGVNNTDLMDDTAGWDGGRGQSRRRGLLGLGGLLSR